MSVCWMQASQPGGFTVPGHLNQANYAQFAAAIAQQAARQRQVQEAQLAQAQQQVPFPPSRSASTLMTSCEGLPT